MLSPSIDNNPVKNLALLTIVAFIPDLDNYQMAPVRFTENWSMQKL